MAREAVMLWTITVISLVLLQLPYTYGQKRTGTIFKNNNYKSWSEVSVVTDETTNKMVTATSESTNETTSEMAPSSGCDISIPSKLMDFCRINESVPCDEVWHHVDIKCYVIGGVAVAAVVMVLVVLVVVICCLCHCSRLHSCCHYKRCCNCCRSKRCDHCRRGYQIVETDTLNDSVGGGFEMNLADCWKSSSSQEENDQSGHCVPSNGSQVQDKEGSNETEENQAQVGEKNEGGIVEENDNRSGHCVPSNGSQVRDKEGQSEENQAQLGERDGSRIEEENDNQKFASDFFHEFFEDPSDYFLLYPQYQCDAYLGSRLQKYWHKGWKKSSKECVLVTLSPISKKCPFKLHSELEKISEILKKVSQHHHIHPIREVEIANDGHIVLVQPYREKGSLRDTLNKNANPNDDWDKKYGMDPENKTPCKKQEIFGYGSQLLQAFLYLYELGFPPLGNMHTGNIFITEEGIKLGGYENVLLGYRTCLYRDIEQEDYLRQIDGIMFGHVIFEMACGFEPGHVFPTDEDYQKVEDDEVREVLRRIFDISKTEMDYIALMREITSIPQFNATQRASPTESEALSSGAKDLLKQVRDKVVGEKKTRKKEKEDKKVPTLTTESWKTPDNIAAAKEMFLGTQIPSIFEIGQRNERIWMIKEDDEGSTHLQTITKIPLTCPIYLSTSFQALSELTQDLAKCPFLLPLVECEYSKVNGHHLVSMLYPLQEEGSLRDVMCGTKPMDGWESKMTAIKGGRHNRLTPQQIASYGHQILTAMEYVYGLGFPPLGHVHTGNIFVEGDMCRLGGYENTLLGYRTHRYDLYSSHGEELIDVIMFGHVLYEMIYMRELTTLTPSKEEYESIKPQLKEALQYVFADGISHSISDILELPFFKSASLPQNMIQLQPSTLSARVKYLLKKVRKGKHRDQDDTLNEFRTKGHVKLKEAGERTKKKFQSLLHPKS